MIVANSKMKYLPKYIAKRDNAEREKESELVAGARAQLSGI